MDSAGNHFLAGAGFTDDEDGGVVAGNPLDHAEKLAHGLAANHRDHVSDLNPILRWIMRRAVRLVSQRRLKLRAYTESFPGHRSYTLPRPLHIIVADTEKVTFV
jgi:hypothetical protein